MACIYFPITKHKSFELQFETFSDLTHTTIVEIGVNWSTEQDHAGISFTFSIYRTMFCLIQIYDNRHWDFETNNWENKEVI